MLRMIQQNQLFVTTTKTNQKNTSLICNKYLISEFLNEIKYTLKSEDWALFALVGIVSCDIAIVLTMLAYKKVFSEAIRKPLIITCPFLTVFGIIHIFISWYVYIRKKRRLYRSRRENSRQYMQMMICAEEETNAKCTVSVIPERSDYHVVIQEIKPGIIFGKVISDKEQISQESSRTW